MNSFRVQHWVDDSQTTFPAPPVGDRRPSINLLARAQTRSHNPIALLAVLLVTAGVTSPVLAENWPSRKPGLWEVMIQSDQEPPLTSRQCIDAKTDAQLQSLGRGMMAANCSKDTFRREAGGYASESVCKLGNTTVTSRGLITGDFNSEVKMVVDAQFAPPMMGMAKSKTTVTQRWKGACPADWKPGDMEVPGSKQRMNVNKLPALAPQR
jgi:Protein of unknown function (DUF3617)